MNESRDGHEVTRADLLAVIDAASPEPLLPYQRDFLAGMLEEDLRLFVHGRPGRAKPAGLMAAYAAAGYPYKARHKPRRPPKRPRP